LNHDTGERQSGRTAVATGASTGIGWALACAMGGRGLIANVGSTETAEESARRILETVEATLA
jgi:NAD(P)-dependent dehydrogenase (short-subunit alcohol dehydrogenase family)